MKKQQRSSVPANSKRVERDKSKQPEIKEPLEKPAIVEEEQIDEEEEQQLDRERRRKEQALQPEKEMD
jgi:hypothetical protein